MVAFMSLLKASQLATFFPIILGLACLHPAISPALALLLGLCCTLVLGNPHVQRTEKLPKPLLALCIIGLGAGMNVHQVLEIGIEGLCISFGFMMLTLICGLLLIRLLGVDRESGFLITAGTAICGGSAIAAVSSTMNARSHAVAVSMAVVFVLNGLALLIFPYIGQWFELSQSEFGLWAAIAIHDTSSVVGASAVYGAEALEMATSTKLARTLWIIPLVLALPLLYGSGEQGGSGSLKFPWFILGFIVMAALFTLMPQFQSYCDIIAMGAKQGLSLTLFIIGLNVNITMLKTAGPRPFILGASLWCLVSVLSLLVFLNW